MADHVILNNLGKKTITRTMAIMMFGSSSNFQPGDSITHKQEIVYEVVEDLPSVEISEQESAFVR